MLHFFAWIPLFTISRKKFQYPLRKSTFSANVWTRHKIVKNLIAVNPSINCSDPSMSCSCFNQTSPIVEYWRFFPMTKKTTSQTIIWWAKSITSIRCTVNFERLINQIAGNQSGFTNCSVSSYWTSRLHRYERHLWKISLLLTWKGKFPTLLFYRCGLDFLTHLFFQWFLLPMIEVICVVLYTLMDMHR